jgi:GntR family transcriptional regulator
MDHVALPLYQQVKEDIKAAIENGRYKPQEKIPAEPELSAEYSVSRITVRRAIEELCSEGYLVKMQGRGTFVSSPRIHRKMFNGNET